MSERKDQQKNEYSVDDILAEYGSGRYKGPKVVAFPEADKQADPPRRSAEKQDEASGEQAGEEPVEIVEIRPASPFHALAARLSTLRRKADHYADHMYDQAEPDEETRKAERYIPGVDREETAQPIRRPARKPRVPRPAPPDTAPAELVSQYAKQLRGRKLRLVAAMLSALLCAAASLSVLDGVWAAAPFLTPRWVTLALTCLTGAACWDVIARGLGQLAQLRVGAETIPALAFLLTAGDGLALALSDYREGLSCGAVVSFSLAFALWGDWSHRRGDRLSARTAAQVKAPFAVTLDEEKWSGRPTYVKWSSSQAGFGSQLQSDDLVQKVYAVAGPLLVLGCLVCAGLTGSVWKDGNMLLWCASATLTAASAWSALLVYGLPYHKLARRLFNVGAALAGWPGVARGRESGIIMTDNDLFPTGTVQVSGVRVFGDFPNEKVVGYTATMLRVLDCGLTRPFHDLLRSQGAFYREASGIRYHEGGISGIIRNQEVLVGTASFMHLMDVGLPQGLNVKHAVFCAIDGRLAGIFALNYALSPAVKPCLSALMRAGASPILATRDPNLIPALLEQKFKLPVDRMEFPPVDRRLELSGQDQDHDDTLVALLSREGIGPYCDAVVGARRLRTAVRLGLAFVLAGSVVGVALTFYLCYMGATASLTPVNFLVFMALWLVPTWVLDHWVNQY